MNSITIILLCVVFLVVQQGTDALTCYICSPGTDGCGAKFKKTGGGVIPTSDTSGTITYCTKTVYSSNTNAMDHGADTGGICTSDTAPIVSSTTTTYCCSTDLCNKASMGKASFIFAVVSAVTGLLLIK